MTVSFSINMYDKDGDFVEEGLYLHLDDIAIIRLERNGLQDFIDQLKKIDKEIKENY